jgi:opacity protein-like surface antigen
MTKRRTLSFSILAAALLALCFPAVAAAQWDRYPDYGRDRDRDNGRYGRYDDRYLRNSIQRLDRLSKNFESAENQRANGNLQVGKVDPVPALSLKATQRKSGDRVHLPDLQFKGLERSSWRLPAGSR